MYHLLIKYDGWSESGRSSIGSDRVFGYTDDRLHEKYKPNGELDVGKISKDPAIFVSEIDGSGDQFARIGYIQGASVIGREVHLSYTFDTNIPPIANTQLKDLSSELNILSFSSRVSEFFRTHWAIKDVDLFKVLYAHQIGFNLKPQVFNTDALYKSKEDLMSVMMPFDEGNRPVYKAIKDMSESHGMSCHRADDIWNENAVIQDIVSLICRSRIIICDFSGRNPNVFYEAGIAHTLGKDVILITQSEYDIPFNLQHLRYISYLKNREGIENLIKEISNRITTIVSSTRQ